MRDIEETDTISAVQMLLDNAFGIEDGHVIASEWNHLCLEHILVISMEVSGLQGLSCRELSSGLSESFADHLYILSIYIIYITIKTH